MDWPCVLLIIFHFLINFIYEYSNLFLISVKYIQRIQLLFQSIV